MASQAERVQLLVDLSKELEHHGQLYLAAMWVAEAYALECLAGAVFGAGSLDDAVLRLNVRLRRMLPAKAAAVDPAPVKRGRKARQQLQRMPLPDVSLALEE